MSEPKVTVPMNHYDGLIAKIKELEKDIKAEYENAHDFNIEHEELKHRVEVSESINSELYNMLFAHLDNWDLSETKEIDHDDIAQALEAHNLEQQAKALYKLHKEIESGGSRSLMTFILEEEADILRNQAKALKESK